MTWVRRVIVWLFGRSHPSVQAIAKFDDQASEAMQELDRQRAGLEREARQRQRVQAELQRMILTATRDALGGPNKRQEIP